MAATTATSGYGTLFKQGATTVVEVASITGPGMSRNMIDATHLSSDDTVKEFVAGLIDGGQVTLDLNWLPTEATHVAFLTDFLAGTTQTYSIVWSDTGATICTFDGKVQSISPAAPKDDRLSCTVVIQATTKSVLS